jgi:hypothetical protein
MLRGLGLREHLSVVTDVGADGGRRARWVPLIPLNITLPAKNAIAKVVRASSEKTTWVRAWVGS